MKKILFSLLIIPLVLSCKDDEACYQTWSYNEYCNTTSGCNVVGCQDPKYNERKFKCDEVKDVKEGDVVLIRTDGCAKFYRRYLKKM